MERQDYWVKLSKNDYSKFQFNPRAEMHILLGEIVKVWWGYGYPDKTMTEDKKAIREELLEKGIRNVKITLGSAHPPD